MEITEVRIKLTEESDDRLQAFCSVTFDDDFVVRDLKIIEGTNGPFVAMPSRKLTSHCQRCRSKNHIRANYCNQCGAKASGDQGMRDQEGRAKLYADIAHPINSTCREMIQNRVVEEYNKERTLSERPDYVSRYEDDYDDVFVGNDFEEVAIAKEDKPSPTKIDIQPSQAGPSAPHSPSSPMQGKTPHSRSGSHKNPSSRKISGSPTNPSGFGAGILDE